MIFMDQNFFNRPSWVNTIDNAMSSDGLDYRLIVNARSDSILKARDNLAEVQKHGRIYVVRLGVESFLDEQLVSWNKKVTAEQNMQAIDVLLDYDVVPQIYIIVADKDSTLDTIEEYAQTFKDHPEYFPFLFGETTMMYQKQEIDHQYPGHIESFWHLFAGVGEFNRRIDKRTYQIWEDTIEGVRKNRKLPETNAANCVKAIDEGMEIIRSIERGETTSKAEESNIFSKSTDILHAVYTSYR